MADRPILFSAPMVRDAVKATDELARRIIEAGGHG